MQFVKNGPNIPNHLLYAHEQGKVLFLCGAGISYPAGLPGFAGLVEQVYQCIGEQRNSHENSLFNAHSYDVLLGSLEKRITGGASTVRKHLQTTLKPDLTRPRALLTHLALLELSQNRQTKAFQLITTNFDRLFELAAEKYGFHIPLVHPSPPSRLQWHGIVHLHGRLPDDALSIHQLNELVLSDADFGRAYLTEGWAARYLSEVLRTHSICFVGYSVDDPVMRYITAAHASSYSDNKLFALAACDPNALEASTSAWEQKNVQPILYSNANNHAALHKTLHLWASLYRAQTQGKLRIVNRYAGKNPEKSTEQNNFAGRVLWALSDASGRSAQHFARINPVPDLAWLKVFESLHFTPQDLTQFGTYPMSGGIFHTSQPFSLFKRPAPIDHTSRLSLQATANQWDSIMHGLAFWLLRHINHEKVLQFLIRHADPLHPELWQLIDKHLKHIEKLESENNFNALNQLRSDAPDCIPDQAMRLLLKYLLEGRISDRHSEWRPELDIQSYFNELLRTGSSLSLRLKLLRLLKPIVILSGSIVPNRDEHKAPLRATVSTAAKGAFLSCKRQPKSNHLTQALSSMIDELTMLLKEALDILSSLGHADEFRDGSVFQLISLSPAPSKNRRRFVHHDGWGVYLLLCRDAWIVLSQTNPCKAKVVAEQWWHMNYPAFRRLAMFAAAQGTLFSCKEILEWFQEDHARWLWPNETVREKFRLLAYFTQHASPDECDELQLLILAGQHPDLLACKPEYRKERELKNQGELLRAISSFGMKLNDDAIQILTEAQDANPSLKEAHKEEEELYFALHHNFPESDIPSIPKKREAVASWLEQYPQKHNWKEDEWSAFCKRYTMRACWALKHFAQKDTWPVARWIEFLNAVVSHPKRSKRIWKCLHQTLTSAPQDMLYSSGFSRSLSLWLSESAHCIGHLDSFIRLCNRLIQNTKTDNIRNTGEFCELLHHPISKATSALCIVICRNNINNHNLNECLDLLKQTCLSSHSENYYSKVMLYHSLPLLMEKHEAWCVQHMLPLLLDSEKHLKGSTMCWQALLYTHGNFESLYCIEAFIEQLLGAAKLYENFDDNAKTLYAQRLLQIATYYIDASINQKKSIRNAFEILPNSALERIAWELMHGLENVSAEEGKSIWRNTIHPLWQTFWPKSASKCTTEISNHLAELVVRTGNAFPDALKTLRPWLEQANQNCFALSRLIEESEELIESFPDELFEFAYVLAQASGYYIHDLIDLFKVLLEGQPQLKEHKDYPAFSNAMKERGWI